MSLHTHTNTNFDNFTLRITELVHKTQNFFSLLTLRTQKKNCVTPTTKKLLQKIEYDECVCFWEQIRLKRGFVVANHTCISLLTLWQPAAFGDFWKKNT